MVSFSVGVSGMYPSLGYIRAVVDRGTPVTRLLRRRETPALLIAQLLVCRGRPRKPRPRDILFGAQDKASSRSFRRPSANSAGQSTSRGADLSPTLPMMPNSNSSRGVSLDMDSAKLPSGRLSTEVSLPSAGDVVEKRKLEKTISGSSCLLVLFVRCPIYVFCWAMVLLGTSTHCTARSLVHIIHHSPYRP